MLSGYSNKEHKHLSNESQVKYQDYQSHMQGSKSMALSIKKKRRKNQVELCSIMYDRHTFQREITQQNIHWRKAIYFISWHEMKC